MARQPQPRRDAIQMLADDHRMVEDLFEKYENARSASRLGVVAFSSATRSDDTAAIVSPRRPRTSARAESSEGSTLSTPRPSALSL